MSDAYLWDRSGLVDPDIARLERVLGTLRAPDPPLPLPLPLLMPTPGTARAEGAEAWPAPGTSGSPVPGAGVSEGPEIGVGADIAVPAPEGVRIDWRTRWRRPPVRPAHVEPGRTSPSVDEARAPMRRFVLPFAVAATLAIAAGNVWLSWHWTAPRASWQVSRLEGTPRVASKAIAETPGDLPVGEWLETDAQARARIRVPHVGRIDVEPGTRVGLLSARPGDYRLRLDRGTLQALIWAAPGQFYVETPAAMAVDLGCAYTLRVSEDGDESVVEVTSGWVALEGGDRTAVVRAGALCAARRGIGPGSPHANDVSAAFAEALRVLDFGGASPEARAAALDRVLAEARANDAITLWHLLSRVDGADRDRVFDRLATFAPPPSDVTREGVRGGSAAMLDRWWTGARLGPPRKWR